MKRSKDYPAAWLQQDGILAWYDLRPDTSALCIHMPNGLLDMIRDGRIEIVRGEDYSPYSTDILLERAETFDYVFMYDTADYCDEIRTVLGNISRLLKDDGKFILMARNKLAISRFCGNVRDVARYSRNDYRSMLADCGLSAKFFSVFPSLNASRLIFSEDYLPNESMQVRYVPEYNDCSTIFYRENALCDDLIENGALHQFANAFFIECSKTGNSNCPRSVTVSLNRKPERAFITRCFQDRVEKAAYFDEGIVALNALMANQQYLKARGIDVVDYTLDGDILSSGYIEAPVAVERFTELAYTDREGFLNLMDKFYGLICSSSDIIANSGSGPVLRKGFIDLIPLNTFYKNGKFIVFDQEFEMDNIPAALIMYRAIVSLFERIEIGRSLITDGELFDRYGISGNRDVLSGMEREFIRSLGDYHTGEMVTVRQINENWERLFGTGRDSLLLQSDLFMEDRKEHCFDNADSRSVYVWGTGKWAGEFMRLYKDGLDIAGVVDNNPEKQGKSFFGLTVTSPAFLAQEEDFKIIICVKNSGPIILQLVKMGIKDFGIYDAGRLYSGRLHISP